MERLGGNKGTILKKVNIGITWAEGHLWGRGWAGLAIFGFNNKVFSLLKAKEGSDKEPAGALTVTGQRAHLPRNTPRKGQVTQRLALGGCGHCPAAFHGVSMHYKGHMTGRYMK